jgi:hypothetical protein
VTGSLLTVEASSGFRCRRAAAEPRPDPAKEVATDREVFEAYVEEVLTQSLQSGQIVVMDNLTAHKSERLRELIEERGCELLNLPPYSPDLKWDEKAERAPHRLR